MSDDLKKALKVGVLDRNQRSTLCRDVVYHLINQGIHSNDHLKAAATKMVEVYAPMKRLSDPLNVSTKENISFYKKLLKCRNRKLRGNSTSSSASKPPSGPLSEMESQELMMSNWANGQRSVTIMATLLEATREMRIKASTKEKALSLLINYPALSIPSLVILHLYNCLLFTILLNQSFPESMYLSLFIY